MPPNPFLLHHVYLMKYEGGGKRLKGELLFWHTGYTEQTDYHWFELMVEIFFKTTVFFSILRLFGVLIIFQA